MQPGKVCLVHTGSRALVALVYWYCFKRERLIEEGEAKKAKPVNHCRMVMSNFEVE